MKVALGLQVAGAVFVAVGASMIYLPAGFVVAGISMLVFGLAVEREER